MEMHDGEDAIDLTMEDDETQVGAHKQGLASVFQKMRWTARERERGERETEREGHVGLKAVYPKHPR